MGERTRYNDFARFWPFIFLLRCKNLIECGIYLPEQRWCKGYEDVPIAITRPLIRLIVGQTSLLHSSWRKEKSFSPEYPEMKFLAYFQAYTNTYAELDKLRRMYEEALR